jgi:hypothetical protein
MTLSKCGIHPFIELGCLVYLEDMDKSCVEY